MINLKIELCSAKRNKIKETGTIYTPDRERQTDRDEKIAFMHSTFLLELHNFLVSSINICVCV